jgi:hypothetical protein
LRLEPPGGWFSLWLRWLGSPKQADYDKLALRVAGLVPEIELALSEDKLGPHMRRVRLGLGVNRMNALHILFKTSRFNLSKVGEHFINPCCFGEDLAAWLRLQLGTEEVVTAQTYQEDWGWEVPVTHVGDSYYLCMSGNADHPDANSDEGEWRIIVEKRRSLWKRLTGKGKIAPDDALVVLIENILFNQPGIIDFHRE